jgi:hypothetical protein
MSELVVKGCDKNYPQITQIELERDVNRLVVSESCVAVGGFL